MESLRRVRTQEGSGRKAGPRREVKPQEAWRQRAQMQEECLWAEEHLYLEEASKIRRRLRPSQELPGLDLVVRHLVYQQEPAWFVS